MMLIVTVTLPLLTITDKETINEITEPPRNASYTHSKEVFKKSAIKVNAHTEMMARL